MAADAVNHCVGANIVDSTGDDVTCNTAGEDICEYTPKAGSPAFTGSAACVKKDYYEYVMRVHVKERERETRLCLQGKDGWMEYLYLHALILR